ncbi:MAG: MCE family protein [Actinomycetes bacterium]
MKPFRERNPVSIGALGLGLVAALVLGAFNADRLPFIGGGPTYAAALADAGGLVVGDDVDIAGVKVGTITGIALAGDYVRVDFQVTRGGVHLGTQTSAAVRIKTMLGTEILMLTSAGPGQLRAGQEIPLSRTTPAYTVVQAISGLTRTNERIDTTQLADALNVLATDFRSSPPQVRAALAGLSRLSTTIASRDAQLRALLSHAQGVTAVLAARHTSLTTLVDEGNLLLAEVSARRQSIHQLLVSTAALAQQLTGLVADNKAQLGPALAQLEQVVAVLQANQGNLDRSIAALAPFVRVYADTLGNGRWFDTYVQNLVPVPGAPTTPGGVG